MDEFSAKGIFSGKRILIVGGTGGIGAALTRRLIPEKGKITVIGRHDPFATAPDAPDTPAPRFIRMDLDKPDCLPRLCAEAEKADALCVARGAFLQKPLHETSMEEWGATVFSNLVMPGAAVSSALPRMMKNRWGRILLFGGTRTERVRGFKTNAAYAAAKTGVSSLIRSVAEHYGGEGICCCGICPGFTETEYISETQKSDWSSKLPGKTLLSPERIADYAMLLLTQPELNGCIITPDFGWTPCKNTLS